MPGDLLVINGRVWAGQGREWRSGAVEIKAGRITYVGPQADHVSDLPPERTIDAQGGLVLPGLVNAHAHGAMTLFRGLADDLPLETWLNQHIFPAEARWVDPEMVELCTLLAAGEMLLSGTTCVADSYFCMEGGARAYLRAGMRAVVAQGVIDFPAPGVPDPSRRLETGRRFLEEWRGASPLLTPGLFAHSAYTCSGETLRQVSELAGQMGAPWFTHLAETRQEVELLRERHGQSPAFYLDSLGVLSGLTAAVHGTWLSREEMDLLAQRGVAVAACVESNMKLGSGVADLPAMLAAGLTVGLGTDGPASNNDLSMIGELGMAARLAKLNAMDPTALPAATALEMATRGSAAALGLAGVTGSLAPGLAGDLVVLKTRQPHLTPLFDAASALAYQCRGADVRHVAVDGQLLVREGRVESFDLAAVMAEVRQLARRVSQ